METVFSLARLGERPAGVATIGVFDGVHAGHSGVLAATVEWARSIGAPSIVITFDRHPERVLRGASPDSITSLEHKLRLIGEAGIDLSIVLHFGREMADMPAERFVREILIDALAVRGVVLGYNARFGRGGAGDEALLVRMGAEHGFEVRVEGPLEIDGAPVSSTRIRLLIESGRLDEAARLLGRPFTLRGTVVHGDKRGRDLGFPTANLNLHHEATPPTGVYIARAWLDGREYWGLVNIGVRPTFVRSASAPKAVEVHLADYAGGEFYGRTLEVEPVRFLRREERFDSAEALVARMRQDMRILETFRRTGEAAAKS